MHIQRHTHTSTHVQSAHKRNCDNQAQEPGWEGRRKGFVRDLAHTQKIISEKNRYSRIWRKRFEHIELPAKLLDYFLRSNKSNINQPVRSYKSDAILVFAARRWKTAPCVTGKCSNSKTDLGPNGRKSVPNPPDIHKEASVKSVLQGSSFTHT